MPGRGNVARLLLAAAGAGAAEVSRVETVVGAGAGSVAGLATFMSALRASSSASAASGSTRPQPIWSSRLLVPIRVALAVKTSRMVCASASGWRLQQQRRDAADMGGRDRGSGGELIGAGGGRHHDV